MPSGKRPYALCPVGRSTVSGAISNAIDAFQQAQGIARTNGTLNAQTKNLLAKKYLDIPPTPVGGGDPPQTSNCSWTYSAANNTLSGVCWVDNDMRSANGSIVAHVGFRHCTSVCNGDLCADPSCND